jgi:hypothetical protein
MKKEAITPVARWEACCFEFDLRTLENCLHSASAQARHVQHHARQQINSPDETIALRRIEPLDPARQLDG